MEQELIKAKKAITKLKAKVQKAYELGYEDGESSITVVSAIAYLEENGFVCTRK